MRLIPARPFVLALFATLLALAGSAVAQEAPPAHERYRTPSDDIVRILKAEPLPSVSLNPTRTHMLLQRRQAMPTIADLAEPMLRLAGRRINPANNAPHGSANIIGLTVKEVATGQERAVELPGEPRIQGVSWSPDGARFAFVLTHEDGSELWIGDAATAEARKLTERNLNTLVSGGFNWMPDGKTLLAFLIPEGRGPAPDEPRVPDGPVVQESAGRTSPVRTFQDLLQDQHDEALFDYYFTSRPVLMPIDGGEEKEVGPSAVYSGISASPTGRYLLVSRIMRPYSYMVTMGSFPETIEVLDLETMKAVELARLPLRDQTPIGGVDTGPRGHQWQDTAGVDRLLWAEALDDGNPRNKDVPHRDRIMALAAPFTEPPIELWRTQHRFAGINWLEGGARALVSEFDRDRRWSRTWLVDLSRPVTVQDAARTAAADPRDQIRANVRANDANDPVLIWDRSTQDRYGDPGRPVSITNAAGRNVVDVETVGGEEVIYLSGNGASPEGDRPFLDRMSLSTRESDRLWQNSGESFESFVAILDAADDAAGPTILTRHETPVEPPNYFRIDLGNNAEDARAQLTDFEHPAPQLREIRKELVTYQRDDGVTLSATLYLPPDYQEGQRLPLIVWAYPREFNDPAMASQVSGSPYRFTTIGGISHLFLLLEGYAIMDGATMPVVGDDPLTVNDTFIKQIVASAKAAIDYAAERGVADPERVGVGGHSYGAFMTANLLAHSDLFDAGVARSGAYNRTLTPFGFQSEERTFWEAPDVYFNLSPFMHADKIDEPLLLIHGEMDNNSGTFPEQSERLYHAVKGHGGTVRLVMLPYESHGYRAEESVMHTLAEMIDWFDQHVKQASPGAAPGNDEATGN